MHINHDYNQAAKILSANFWLIATTYIAVLSPISVLIKSFIEYEKWLPADASLKGLPNAGKWIGYLERILILTFIFGSVSLSVSEASSLKPVDLR